MRLEEFLELMWVKVLEDEREYVEEQMSSILAIQSVVEMVYRGESTYVKELLRYLDVLGGTSGDGSSGYTKEEYEELKDKFNS